MTINQFSQTFIEGSSAHNALHGVVQYGNSFCLKSIKKKQTFYVVLSLISDVNPCYSQSSELIKCSLTVYFYVVHLTSSSKCSITNIASNAES